MQGTWKARQARGCGQRLPGETYLDLLQRIRGVRNRSLAQPSLGSGVQQVALDQEMLQAPRHGHPSLSV